MRRLFYPTYNNCYNRNFNQRPHKNNKNCGPLEFEFVDEVKFCNFENNQNNQNCSNSQRPPFPPPCSPPPPCPPPPTPPCDSDCNSSCNSGCNSSHEPCGAKPKLDLFGLKIGNEEMIILLLILILIVQKKNSKDQCNLKEFVKNCKEKQDQDFVLVLALVYLLICPKFSIKDILNKIKTKL